MTEPVIIGAGPAGLTAALELSRRGRAATVLEQDQAVGGIARTIRYKGYRFDIGGHRFFTKAPEVQQIWEEILGEDLLERPRLSRIFYNDRFFDYPLRPLNALRGLGALEAARVGLSYMGARLAPHREERNFEQWVSNRFGRRLYEIFFKTYTEKVWGMPCTEISADWAAQRIKNLDLLKAVRNALLGNRGSQQIITTLIDSFHYPRLGPGMMWERCLERVRTSGIRVELGSQVVQVLRRGSRVVAVVVERSDGHRDEMACSDLISTMPLRRLVEILEPAVPDDILAAARRLRYRDFLTVVLIVDRAEVFPDNWIYIHSPAVRVGRIQNFKNWSPDMVPDPNKTSLGLEYFVDRGDRLWSASDEDLIELGTRELSTLGLLDGRQAEDGVVVRMPHAYPIYDGGYRDSLMLIRGFLAGMSNLQTVGRNGQHRYNNQDHSMLAGIFAAQNLSGGRHDVWSVNVDPDYHEVSTTAGGARAMEERLIPRPVADKALEESVREAFARYDPVALGAAFGAVAGCGLFAATALLLLAGGDPVGPTLSLLGNYLLGYEVTWAGAVLGFLEAGGGGFGLGYAMAKAINLLVAAVESTIRRELELGEILDPLSRRQS